ncbi:MAG: metallophosphoesterase [Pseudomonadota bacterium]
MKRLLILSDTHLAEDVALPAEVTDLAKDCDGVIHAGDVVTPGALAKVQALGPATVVRGNMDHPALKRLLPEVAEVTVEGVKIGVIHGWGGPQGIVQRILPKVQDQGFDVVVYGHSHQPDISGTDGILFINPGSPTDQRCAPYCSAAILEVADGAVVDARIVKIGR